MPITIVIIIIKVGLDIHHIHNLHSHSDLEHRDYQEECRPNLKPTQGYTQSSGGRQKGIVTRPEHWPRERGSQRVSPGEDGGKRGERSSRNSGSVDHDLAPEKREGHEGFHAW